MLDSRVGWLCLKDDQYSHWLRNPLGPSIPKEGIHFTKNVPPQPQRQAPKKTKGWQAPDWLLVMSCPTQNACKRCLLWGDFMGALVSAPSLLGSQAGMTAPVSQQHPTRPLHIRSLPALGL